MVPREELQHAEALRGVSASPPAGTIADAATGAGVRLSVSISVAGGCAVASPMVGRVRTSRTGGGIPSSSGKSTVGSPTPDRPSCRLLARAPFDDSCSTGAGAVPALERGGSKPLGAADLGRGWRLLLLTSVAVWCVARSARSGRSFNFGGRLGSSPTADHDGRLGHRVYSMRVADFPRFTSGGRLGCRPRPIYCMGRFGHVITSAWPAPA